MSSEQGQRPSAQVLYISYDGLTDPLGGSQILPYLIGLAALGHRITILSCEKPERMERYGMRIHQICDRAKIVWKQLTYHRHPPIISSALDTIALQRTAVELHRRERFDIVHCRSYIPAHAGLTLKRNHGVRFLFDMRGFWPDEKVEGNNWNLANPFYAAVYRYFKRLESRLLGGADHIVSLTEAGRKQLLTRPEVSAKTIPISVIPCCVDFEHFPLTTASERRLARGQLALQAGVPVLAYLGSLGSWYMLDEMLDFFKCYASRHGGARFLFITLDDPGPILQAAEARGISPHLLVIHPATRDEVPRLATAADLGIFFIKPVFSKTASSPAKMGEMLAIGLPVITNTGVGDVERNIEEMGCGVALSEFTPEAYDDALDRLDQLGGCSETRRDRARAYFDVELGIERYDRIYRELLG